MLGITYGPLPGSQIAAAADTSPTEAAARFVEARPRPGASRAAALIAAGLFFVPIVEAAAETITLDKWEPRLSQPPSPAPSRRAALAASGAFACMVPIAAPETITIDKWFAPPAQPLRPVVRSPGPSIFQAIAPSTFPPPETITLDKWWQPARQPYPARKSRQAALAASGAYFVGEPVAPAAPVLSPRIAAAKPRIVYAAALDYYDPLAAADGTLWLVSKSSRGVNTRADDDPASTHFERRLTAFEGATFAYGPGRVGGAPESADGSLVADNLGSALSKVAGWRFNGKRLRVWRFADGARPVNWERVYTGQCLGQPAVDREQAEWRHAAGLANLDRPLSQRSYAGTGGDEGDATVEGLSKPLVFGKANNVTPRGPAGFATQTYQAHDGRVQSLTATADLEKGFTSNATPDVEGAAPQNELLWNRDFTNAAWTKTSVTVGASVGIDGAARNIRLTATANGGTVRQAIATLAGKACLVSLFPRRIAGSDAVNIRCDGATEVDLEIESGWLRNELRLTGPTELRIEFATSGDSIDLDYSLIETPAPLFPSYPIETTTVAVKDYKSSAAGTLRQAVSQCLGLVPYLDTDETALSALDAVNAAVVGVYVSGGEKAIEVLFALTDSIGAYPFVAMPTGLLSAKRLDAPSSAPAPALSLSEGRWVGARLYGGNIRAITPLLSAPALWRVTLGYAKDWSPATNRQGTVARDKVDRDLVRAAVRLGVDLGAYRAKEATNAANKTEWGETQDTDVAKLTLLDDATAAQTEATRLLALRGQERRLYRIETTEPPGWCAIGDSIAVTAKDVTYDGAGSPQARNMVVLGVTIAHAAGGAVNESLTVEVWG